MADRSRRIPVPSAPSDRSPAVTAMSEASWERKIKDALIALLKKHDVGVQDGYEEGIDIDFDLLTDQEIHFKIRWKYDPPDNLKEIWREAIDMINKLAEGAGYEVDEDESEYETGWNEDTRDQETKGVIDLDEIDPDDD